MTTKEQGLSSLALWWAMHEAEWELAEQVIPDDAPILSYMGCGASHSVFAGDLRAAFTKENA